MTPLSAGRRLSLTSFNGATFSGDTSIGGATFSGDTSFGGATFSGERTSFARVTFSGETTSFEPRRWQNVIFDWDNNVNAMPAWNPGAATSRIRLMRLP